MTTVWRPQRPAYPRRLRAARLGFTLVEVLLVVALMAVLVTVILSGSGLAGNARLRASATLVLSAVRLGVSQANASGQPVRLVFDLEQQRVILEQTRGRLLRSADKESPAAGAAPVNEAERQATDYAKGVLDGPKLPRPNFQPVLAFSSGEDAAMGRPLEDGVRFRLVQTDHDLEPRTEGRAYLYFWPGGGTERSVVQLTRVGDEEGLSVVISPLTGRAHIERGHVDFEAAAKDYDFGVHEDDR